MNRRLILEFQDIDYKFVKLMTLFQSHDTVLGQQNEESKLAIEVLAASTVHRVEIGFNRICRLEDFIVL